MAQSDEDLVREALSYVEHIDSQAEKARRLGVSPATMSRWLGGEISTPLRPATRGPLERFVAFHVEHGGGQGGHLVVREDGNVAYSPDPDPEGTPAEQLLHFLGVRAGYRRVAGELTTRDLIAAAYSIARDEGFAIEEFRKLDAWRDAILSEEQQARDA